MPTDNTYNVFKRIDASGIQFESNVVHYEQNLNSGSSGVSFTQFISGSISSSYWDSLHVLYYTSGSPVLREFDSSSMLDKWDSYPNNFSLYNPTNPQHVNKFHNFSKETGSVISIPQKYYGETIKRKSLVITDTSHPSGSIILKDDGYGNLYSSNAVNSQSLNSLGVTGSMSSSVNYIGNVFYDWGFAVITETGSWSGSVHYTDMGTNYSIDFEATTKMYTNEYTLVMNPGEFNYSLNPTLRCWPKNWENTGSMNWTEKQFYCAQYTGSEFRPYITTIGLYSSDNFVEPVAIARLPKPVVKSDKTTTIIKIRLDR